jgi:hypothetical protein
MAKHVSKICLIASKKEIIFQAHPVSIIVILHHPIGIFILRENWKKAKLKAEACHHLSDMTVKMHKLCINEYTN